jgi:two-component system, NarL family, sensor histidine kinase UhpB
MRLNQETNMAVPRVRSPRVWRDMLVIFGVTVLFFFCASYLELSEKVAHLTESMEAWQLDELPLVLLVIFILMVSVLSRRTRQLRKKTDLQIEIQNKLATALDQNRRLTRKNIEIQEAERRSIAHELHDEFGQSMNAIMIDAVAIRNAVDEGTDLHTQAKSIVDVSSKLFSGVRGLLKQLRPVALDELGLATALDYMIEEWRRRFENVTWVSTIDIEDMNLDEVVNITIYRFVQEALTNIVRHSDAVEVKVIVINSKIDGNITIEVRDNGSIKENAESGDGVGLVGLRERIESIGGVFECGVNRPSGFFVSAHFSIDSHASESD